MNGSFVPNTPDGKCDTKSRIQFPSLLLDLSQMAFAAHSNCFTGCCLTFSQLVGCFAARNICKSYDQLLLAKYPRHQLK